jgi:enoyl-CoA hydratase
MSIDDSDTVEYSVAGHTAVIRLNRPQRRNAVNGPLARSMEEIWDRIEGDSDVWVAVITGAGSVFCAGLDLNIVGSGGFRDAATERGGFAGLVQRVRTKPLIAAVNGPALAGGCEIALASDLVVAATNASFGIPEVKRSLVAAAGGLMRLPRTLPRNIAMEMALTGEPITAERAAEFGLVNHLAPEGQALEVALSLADSINANAPLAVRASRQILLDSAEASPEDGWRISWRAAKTLFHTNDFQEGPRAFLEKRPPRWTAT